MTEEELTEIREPASERLRTEADEGQIEARLLETIARYDSPHSPHAATPDRLGERYQIDTAKPLPALDSGLAKAYHVRDVMEPQRALYALICHNGYPYRLRAIEKMRTVSHPHLLSLLEFGVTFITALDEYRMVLVYERPPGQTVTELLAAHGKPFAERTVSEHIIKPLAQAVQEMAAAGVTHGRIHPGNLYFEESPVPRIVLGEGLSEPCGYTQDYFFETVDRALCQPFGKGEGDESADFYALGVLALHLLIGRNPVAEMDRDGYLASRLNMGSYNTLVGRREFTDSVQDMLRGLLNDNRTERWGVTQMEQWADGKKFHLIHPSPPREAPRPFMIGEKEYFNRRSLARGLYDDWMGARAMLRDTKIIRWIELSALKPHTAEHLKRVRGSTGGEAGANTGEDDALVARSILVLDTDGPLRFRDLSAHVDGLGAVAADAYRNGKGEGVQHIARVVELDLSEFWSDLQEEAAAKEQSSAAWRLAKLRPIIRQKEMGFGMERVLYDVNQAIACQSEMLRADHVLTLEQLLKGLDRRAREHAREKDPLDRHIAAFIASRMEMMKAPKMYELHQFPQLMNSRELSMLVMLAAAQKKIGNPKLPGLAVWVALRLLKVSSLIHSRALRRQLFGQLATIAREGDLNQMLASIGNAELVGRDSEGFERAVSRFQRNRELIEYYADSKKMKLRADQLGARMTIGISYAVCAVTILMYIRTIGF